MKTSENTAQSGRIALMLTIGFFTGIFIATLDVGASTLFLDTFEEQTYLPKAIIVSGILGVAFTYLFAFLQNKVQFQTLAASYILVMVLLITSFRIGLYYLSLPELLIFSAFVCTGPFTTVAFLIFWGVFGRIFSLRESKKMISKIDSGQLIASIIALFTIPVVLTFLSNTADLLWISACSATVILLIITLVNRKYNLNKVHKEYTSKEAQEYSFGKLITNSYVVLMALFVIISVVAVYLLNYSFLSVTANQFPNSRDLANFISIFTGTIVIFNFLIQNFVTDRIINMYGLKVTLLINPVLLCFFTLLAAIIGSYLGYANVSDTFILFFLAVSLSKLFAVSLRDALDNPTFKLYLLPLDTSVRFNVQARIEGVVTMFAVFVAGSLLWLLKYFALLELVYFSYALMPIIAFWVYSVNKLYGQYRYTLEQSLEKSNNQKDFKHKKTYFLDALLANKEYLQHQEYGIYGLKLIERVEPALLNQALAAMQYAGSDALANYVTQKIKSLSVNITVGSGKNFLEESPLLEIASAGNKLKFNSFGMSAIGKLIRSDNPSDRITGIQLLSKIINDDNVTLLTGLLHDSHVLVKKEAIAAAGKVKRPETWPILLDLLAEPVYSHIAAVALIEPGDQVLTMLETSFHKSGQNTRVLQKLIYIYGQIGTPKAADFLWAKIEYPDVKITTDVLIALNGCGFQATHHKFGITRQLIEREIGIAAWNQAAILEVADEPYNQFVLLALDEEMNYNFERIFLLLSLIYNPQSIGLVKENIESGSSESKVYALELLDVFIDKHLKTILYPLLDDIPASEEVSIYQAHFPRETLTTTQVLLHILSREYNAINRWTKACAMYSLAKMPNVKVTYELSAHIFNPDPLLRETAAWAIYQKEPLVYQEQGKRIKPAIKAELDSVIITSAIASGTINQLFFNKVLFLKEAPLFNSLAGRLLADFTDTLQLVFFKKGAAIIARHQPADMPLYIIASGTVKYMQEDSSLPTILGQGDLIGEKLILDTDTSPAEVIALQDVWLYAINKEVFYSLMYTHPQSGYQYVLAMSKLLTQVKEDFI